MLNTLITSKTRKKLLLKFFLNSASYTYLRNLEQELGESPNALRVELGKFEKANMLISSMHGNKKMYRVNTNHPLFSEIHNIIYKTIGFDQIIDRVVKKLGGINSVYLTGSFAHGLDSNIIDLLLVGDEINTDYLVRLIPKTEKLIGKRIRYLVSPIGELNNYLDQNNGYLLLWTNN
ncbi:MAG: nucleotidyltransferase domain-containing protein [Bacteroidales bacterium]|nr:nucleotidyltransferase domain-containing protein [Bacteroidales bacterium]